MEVDKIVKDNDRVRKPGELLNESIEHIDLSTNKSMKRMQRQRTKNNKKESKSLGFFKRV